ncbi:pre-mRNA-splicing factor atp-dependent RNA helicase deah3-related [Anaeramoeba flamelloides]|uniref:RNA helicase n=1 Tax=Anaeramoeba flamelloides TaxID=1746091 RepID=A0AAV7YS28_9EUKA|nr:pre-mRNA-splicing factor atp-dependent RNA helicase deah3-related [Anaeramoeba flamelloides]
MNEFQNYPKRSILISLTKPKLVKLEFNNQFGFHPLTNQPYSEQYYELLKTREKLPITATKENFLKLLEDNQVIILTGETGSGKTTQIPQFILEAGYSYGGRKKICCTQPRRVAALSVATRVSQEMDVELGNEVGYTIRFEDKSSQRTLVKYLTDGMLLREAMTDNNLSKYSVIIIDEAHERTISTDILFGLLKQLLSTTRKDDLKVIIMSATIEHKLFQEYFNNAPHLDVSGRVYPVDIFYLEEPEEDYIAGSIKTCIQIHLSEPKGDILLFLTGQDEIEDCCEKLNSRLSQYSPNERGNYKIIPLYAALPYSEQRKAFLPSPNDKIIKKKIKIKKDGKGGEGAEGEGAEEGEEIIETTLYGRKIIIATNIAETSLTIEGIVYVIDPGLSKQKVFNPKKRVESLLVSPISSASANQRKGRAGRTRRGKCFRLYTEKTFKKLEKQTTPELLRSNLGNVLLNMKKMGIKDLLHFDYLSPPSIELLIRALEVNHYLGGLDENGELTELGHQIAAFPLDPQLSKMLIMSKHYKCCDEILSIAAMLAVSNCFVRPKKNQNLADQAKARFEDPQSDHLTLLNVYKEYDRNKKNRNSWCRNNFINYRTMLQADNVRNQLFQILNRLNLYSLSDIDYAKNKTLLKLNFKKCLVEGFFMQIAHQLDNKNYSTVKDKQHVVIHPSSGLALFTEWILFNEFVLTDRNYIRTCTLIDGQWLVQIAPHYYNVTTFRKGRTRSAIELIFLKRSFFMKNLKNIQSLQNKKKNRFGSFEKKNEQFVFTEKPIKKKQKKKKNHRHRRSHHHHHKSNKNNNRDIHNVHKRKKLNDSTNDKQNNQVGINQANNETKFLNNNNNNSNSNMNNPNNMNMNMENTNTNMNMNNPNNMNNMNMNRNMNMNNRNRNMNMNMNNRNNNNNLIQNQNFNNNQIYDTNKIYNTNNNFNPMINSQNLRNENVNTNNPIQINLIIGKKKMN